MKRCPRCHTSMLLDHVPSLEGSDRVWKCLGCGRESYADVTRQEIDDRLLRGIVVRELHRA